MRSPTSYKQAYDRGVQPNWFIGFPVQADVSLPSAPSRVRLFAPADWHMTVAFLGSVGGERAKASWEAAAPLRMQALLGELTGIKLLGNPRKPAAVTALVDNACHSTISDTIARWRPSLFLAADARPDERAPLPHVTLARIQRRANREEYRAAKAWAGSLDVAGTPFEVNELALYTWSQDRKERLFQIVEKRAIDG